MLKIRPPPQIYWMSRSIESNEYECNAMHAFNVPTNPLVPMMPRIGPLNMGFITNFAQSMPPVMNDNWANRGRNWFCCDWINWPNKVKNEIYKRFRFYLDAIVLFWTNQIRKYDFLIFLFLYFCIPHFLPYLVNWTIHSQYSAVNSSSYHQIAVQWDLFAKREMPTFFNFC